MGFIGNTFKLLGHYLKLRTQITKVNNTKSELKPITCGVPQGSTLCPLLFILYINDLPYFIRGVQLKLYADDTVFYLNAPGIKTAVASMNQATQTLNEWCCLNKLTIIAQKSKSMLFSQKSAKVIKTLKFDIHSVVVPSCPYVLL